MFDRIAGVYDLMNTAMTAGMHHRWRQRAAELAELEPGGAALDVCCGTGDLALELSHRVGPDGTVVGCDFSERMLEAATSKAAERGAANVRFEWADALELPYEDGSFAAATIGFGARNLEDLDRGLRRGGGRADVEEIANSDEGGRIGAGRAGIQIDQHLRSVDGAVGRPDLRAVRVVGPRKVRGPVDAHRPVLGRSDAAGFWFRSVCRRCSRDRSPSFHRRHRTRSDRQPRRGHRFAADQRTSPSQLRGPRVRPIARPQRAVDEEERPAARGNDL